ncbi:putative RNA methyltransferase [Methylosinus sp. C49]|uniref:class I SAM-dependent RNA methyltransferase n=1 Tax=Methylosinus sp. C49 TaxID=2699395 RepID=UPI001366AC46|nr:methyltransferase [Methylosinus sp. C49]BBU63636.1 putative RNA methyltransferase [Methylosinus sp. C49]
MLQRLVIERLGHKGEGVARTEEGLVFAAFALPGETVLAEVKGERARVVDILEPSPDRIEAFCSHYGVCGGCAVQTLAAPAYAQWKRSLAETALRNAGLDWPVEPLIDAHGAGRRRVTFHARYEKGVARVGFMRARSHDLVEIDACPLLEPRLAGAPAAARALAQALAGRGKPLDLAVTAATGGLDIDIRGAGELEERETLALLELAETLDLARLANHGRLVTLRLPPGVMIGKTQVLPPPGAFLQATAEGEAAIARLVAQGVGEKAKRVADLFCGVGAFALRLAAQAQVTAIDSDVAAVEALDRAARTARGLRPIIAQARDLFRRPLDPQELSRFDAVVFDPPRAGALAQAEALAASAARRIVAVSCDPQSFARDAAVLSKGGYAAKFITPIDQFRHSPHLELVALFERAAEAAPRRRLLSR